MNIPGFTPAKTLLSSTRRMIVSAQGLDQKGKSHLLMTAPGPIAYFNFDHSPEGMIEKFLKEGKQIFFPTDEQGKPLTFQMPNLPYPVGLGKTYGRDLTPEQNTAVAQKLGKYRADLSALADQVWVNFHTSYYKALANPHIRTIGIDTGNQMYNLRRQARFGKLTQIPELFYDEINAEFASLLNAAEATDKNFVILHQYRDEYVEETVLGNSGPEKKRRKTGLQVREGWKKIPYYMQVQVECFRDAEGFGLKVLECRQNPLLQGTTLQGACPFDPNIDMASFAGLGISVFEESEIEEWM